MTEIKLTPTAQKLYDWMKPNERYSKSAMGYGVFGVRTQWDKHLEPQGAALAIGRFVRELMQAGLVLDDYRSHPNCWYRT